MLDKAYRFSLEHYIFNCSTKTLSYRNFRPCSHSPLYIRGKKWPKTIQVWSCLD